MSQERLSRGAGVLLPIFSLPSDYGIGTMGMAAYGFIDFLVAAGQKYWQVLPMGPTIFGDSPYQSPSAFAGNPYFIDINALVRDGWLSRIDKNLLYAEDPSRVDYARLYQTRHRVLRQSFEESVGRLDHRFTQFCSDAAWWLDDYSLFATLKNEIGGGPWTDFPIDLREKRAHAILAYKEAHEREILYRKFVQYLFFSQWSRVRAYARERGIEIIGDLPIYLAFDSADVWAHRELFELDPDGFPSRVAGVPPDRFSSDGQLWGNPLYRWDVIERENFEFFRRRAQSAAELYDVLRIDHFIGFVNYYAISRGAATAREGCWNDVPYRGLFAAMEEAPLRFIAEDLGVLSPRVEQALSELGYPGMKILSFAFDSDRQNVNLPHHFTENTVVYGGTHDNEPLLSYFAAAPHSVLDFAADYLGVQEKSPAVISEAIIRAGLQSRADVAIFSLQDYLGMGSESRINTPSVIGGNWLFRFGVGDFSEALSERMQHLAEDAGR
ncbi:MAG: 4-alpha-glucanotransferase [Clostridia bacterium]|nr:4-alpha-glucanotransferase [Clostridia bacterium]